MLLPGTDPVTMLIEMVPLILLYRGERAARPGLRQTARAGGARHHRLRAAAQRRGIGALTATLYASAVLFDLQTPRRRRVVRVVFGGLALIFAVSFVFLGVGTGGGGFSFSDLFGGGGGSSSSTAFDGDIKAAQKQLAVEPERHDGAGEPGPAPVLGGQCRTPSSNGAPTSEGEQHLREAADAWNKYVKAEQGEPRQTAAALRPQHLRPAGAGSTSRRRAPTRRTAEALTDVNAAVGRLEDRRRRRSRC